MKAKFLSQLLTCRHKATPLPQKKLGCPYTPARASPKKPQDSNQETSQFPVLDL